MSLDKGDRVYLLLDPRVAVSSVPVSLRSAINTKVRFSSIIIGDLPFMIPVLQVKVITLLYVVFYE